MTRQRFVGAALVTLLVGLAVEGVTAAQTVRHSGTLLALDTERGTAVIEEVGPWRVKDGQTQVIRRILIVTPATEYALFMRVNASGGFPGDFIEGPLEASDLAPGNFVTAECRLERGRLIAVKITWADPAEPAR
jgi:hypothetical protein